MATGGLTTEDLANSLQDIRLPDAAAGGLLAEILAALGVGLLLAFCVGMIVRLVSRRRSAPRLATLAERIVALEDLPEPERALGLLHILKERDPQAAAQYGSAIYARGGLPDAATLKAAIKDAEDRHA